jgi:hypothetical protein
MSVEKVTLRAHFDGTQILLDEPFELEPDTELVVTVLPKSLDDEEDRSDQSVMARLRQIKISASPDFSIKASLYDIEDKNRR